jgi:hypothetical protein
MILILAVIAKIRHIVVFIVIVIANFMLIRILYLIFIPSYPLAYECIVCPS